MSTPIRTGDVPELVQIGGPREAAPAPRLWRSLEELAGDEEFEEYLLREFPDHASEWTDPTSRRDFLRRMGASIALAGVAGCAFQPPESIVPYVKAPEQFVPGKPLFFATAMTLGGFAVGLLAESHMGRPTKVEGNPDHPASLGGTDAFAQAAVLSLYDPDRSRIVMRNNRLSTWNDLLATLIEQREAHREKRGAGLRILTETVTSPTLAGQIRDLLREFPEARWHQYEPVNRDAARAGARLAFGEDVETIHHFDKADVILSLDADFLSWGPSRLRDARHFTARREVAPDQASRMNRLYVVEGSPTITGAMADHHWAVSTRAVGRVAQAVAQELGVRLSETAQANRWPAGWIAAVARDLKAHSGSSLVLAGHGQPPEVHALAHAMNQQLGNVGKTVEYIAPVEAEPTDQLESLRTLVRDMQANEVDLLVIIGGNPVYGAPGDIDIADGLRKVANVVRLGLYEDETSAHCHWHVPEAHFLEAWSDARAFDGTTTIVQPLIAPIFGGKSAHELLAALLGQTTRSGLEIVRDHWQKAHPDDFEAFWRSALNAGVVAGTASQPKAVTLKAEDAGKGVAGGGTDLEIVFRPDPSVWDGRFANNGWLQELPKPLTKLVWDNAALMSPETARRFGLSVGKWTGEAEMVDLSYRGRSLRLPVWVTPGHADDSVTVHLGYGRTRAGRIGTNVGFNASALRTSDAPWFGTGLTVSKTGSRHRLATTQHHHNMAGRELVRVATAEEYRDNPDFAVEPDEEHGAPLTLYEDPAPRRRHEEGYGNSWGMVININTCIGCNACVAACQAENNIPIVGREEVLRGREMHWIRVDRYYEGDENHPHTYHQPVPCMHCEKAPCELVCPVGATTHSVEGLNEMTYNRCVGTKYCSNNCPYKVRRFNFFQYSDKDTPSLKLLNNPNVTVRTLGVMEKCSYCVQRINAARIQAETENRTVGGNEVQTACQQACPTQAIVFGNLNDKGSDVVRQKADPRNYALLAGLNTRPRTTYLAKLTNPNDDPALKAE